MERWRVGFEGRVQGVGFRATCRQIAGDFAVSGWVRNEPDGSVRLEAQGEAGELSGFVNRITDVMARYIRAHDVEPIPIVRDETTFEIRG